MEELYSTPTTSLINITRNERKHVIVSVGEYAGVMPVTWGSGGKKGKGKGSGGKSSQQVQRHAPKSGVNPDCENIPELLEPPEGKG